jgi:hypothetical protein
MKLLIALAVLLLSLNANAATIRDTIEFTNGSGTLVSRTSNRPFTCPVGSLCYAASYAVYPNWDSLSDYSEIKFLHESADVTFSWAYNNADPNREAFIDDHESQKRFTGLENNSGSYSFKANKGDILELVVSVYSLSPLTEIHYQLAFSNIVELGQQPPPPVIKPVPAPSALTLMLPLLAGFTLRKLSV